MNIINNVNGTIFTLNGIRYFKNFAPLVRGSKVAIVNVYDSTLSLVDFTGVENFTVDGVTFTDLSALVQALIPVVYVREASTMSGEHNDLDGRSAPDAHPISAITGLEDRLEVIVVETATAVNAEFNREYLAVFATTSFADPTPPQEGQYTVVVGNGVATIGGVQYREGTKVIRRWHSGSWTTYAYTPNQPVEVTISANVNISTLLVNDREINLNVGATARTITIDAPTRTVINKIGSGVLTFAQGSGRTLVTMSGDNRVLANFGTARINSVGTSDVLFVEGVAQREVQVMGVDYLYSSNVVSNFMNIETTDSVNVVSIGSLLADTLQTNPALIDIGVNASVFDRVIQASFLQKIEFIVHAPNFANNLTVEFVLLSCDNIDGLNQTQIYSQTFSTTNGFLRVDETVNISVPTDKFITPFWRFPNSESNSIIRNVKLKFYA